MDLYEFIYSMFAHISFMMFIYLILGITLAYFIYNSIITTWFVKGGVVNYDTFLKYFIQVVSKDNYFMNYGYWQPGIDTLYKANNNLVNLILEKSGLASAEIKGQKILDVGCGYAVQDFQWLKTIDPTNHITAIDISESQIQMAKEKCKRSKLDSRLDLQCCDAMHIDKKFAANEFDTVLCVESAFHYPDRPAFFRGVNEVLKDGGRFVICDLTLSDDHVPSLMNGMFLRTFSDFLHIPKSSLIKSEVWKQSILDAGLVIEEYMDITDKTFGPYYNNTFHLYMKNAGIPSTIATIIYDIFMYLQPFSYRLAVCKKPASISSEV
jgi:ubiquinone/menaquinone biosynthesis C-methylase UbiE